MAVTSCEEWGGSASFGLDPLVIDMRLAEMRDSRDYFSTATAEEIIACLDSGANPMARVGHSGETPLHLAAVYSDDPAVVQAMLDAGADPNVRDRWLETPLHWAVQYNRAPVGVLNALLDAGADASAINFRNESVLYRAAGNNPDPADLELLMEAGAEPRTRNVRGLTPLHRAAEYNENPAVLTFLLEAGVDPTTPSVEGETPLHLAAERNGNPAVLEVLIDAGVDTSVPDDEGRTAWDLAQDNEALHGSDAYARLEPDVSEPPVLPSCQHWNTSEYFESASETEVAECLAAGAQSTVWNYDGETPLHIVAAIGNTALSEVLLEAGADPYARNYDGYTPLYVAAIRDQAGCPVCGFTNCATLDRLSRL